MKIVKLFFLLALALSACAQNKHSQMYKESVTFALKGKSLIFKEYKNEIIDQDHTLDSVFRKLVKLKTIKDSICRLTILHIGDSHIQGGILSEAIRINFHHYFGNAGRGLITPYKLAKTNGPLDYSIRSSLTDWTRSRCIEKQPSELIGITGLMVSSSASEVTFKVITKPVDSLDYSFNKIHVYAQSKLLPAAVQNGINSSVDNLNSKILYLEARTNEFDFTCLRSFDTIFFGGVSLENGKSGVLYHAVGVNGAHFSDYNKLKLFYQESRELSPELIIVSLGTNTAFGLNFTKGECHTELATMIAKLKSANPNALIMLTTPAEVWIKRRVRGRIKSIPNRNCGAVAEVILSFARDNNLPVWDMHKATGGANSARIWLRHSMLRSDRIHFTDEAYCVQANLFFEAFTNKYNDYVARLHR